MRTVPTGTKFLVTAGAGSASKIADQDFGEIPEPKKRRGNKEHAEQVAVFQWVAHHRKGYPELDLLFAIPNGGARNIVTAKKLKAEGVKAGVPDLMLPVARNNYHGLFIEMKVEPNKPTPAQIEWISKLQVEGYFCCVAYSWMDAVEILKRYLT